MKRWTQDGRGQGAAVARSAALALALACGGVAQAQRVTLQVTAVNPSPTNAEPVEIRSNLPRGIRPEDVLDAGGLNVRYDVQQELYYVHGQETLEPGQVRRYSVSLRDVWTIPEAEVERIRVLAGRRLAQLQGTDDAAIAARLAQSIADTLDRLLESQRTHALGLVRATEHIRAHELNGKLLARAREDLGHLENFVIAAGQDPGELGGQTAREPAGIVEWPPDAEPAYVTLTFRVHNPARSNQTVLVRNELPAEVRVDDVRPGEDLQVGFDVPRGVTYVFAEDVQLGPGETRAYAVEVRDRWSAEDLRVDALHARATNLVRVIAAVGDFPALQQRLQEAQDALGAVRAAPRPDVRDEDYVAHYRLQRERLDAVEKSLLGVEDLLRRRPHKVPEILQAKIFETPPPDRRTTWVLIYGILGFLLLATVAFYVRWVGRTRPGAGPDGNGEGT